MQRVVQGTYSPLWHLLHHYDATFKLAASGAVPAWRAFLTREHGPGMVRPAIVDHDASTAAGKAGKVAAAPAKGGKKPAVAVSAVAASSYRPAAAPAVAAEADEATLRAYPWELRPLGVLDYYAGAPSTGIIRCSVRAGSRRQPTGHAPSPVPLPLSWQP